MSTGTSLSVTNSYGAQTPQRKKGNKHINKGAKQQQGFVNSAMQRSHCATQEAGRAQRPDEVTALGRWGVQPWQRQKKHQDLEGHASWNLGS